MSFLTRVSPLTSKLASSVTRTTTPAFSVPAFRFVSSTSKKDKGVADATKDTLKKADRAASDAALRGIETGGTSVLPLFLFLSLSDDLHTD
jgi:hypothetical protein